MISFVNLDIARRCKTVCDVAGRSETVTEAHIFSWGSRFGWVAMARRPIWQTVRCAWSRIGQQQRRPFCALAWDRRSGLSCNWGVTGFRRAGKTWVRTRAATWRPGGGPAPRLGASCSRVDLASPAAPALPDRHGASFRMRIHDLANGRGNRSPATIVAPDGDRWRWRSRPRAAGSVRALPIGAARSSNDRKAPGHGRTAHRRCRHRRGEARQTPREQSLSNPAGAWREASGAASPSSGGADRWTAQRRQTGRQSRCR